MRNAGLDEAQAGIKTAGRNINNLRYADDTTLMAESEEELKSLFQGSERGEWKSWLKNQHSENSDHSIWCHNFMANRWGNNGNSHRLYLFGLQNHCRLLTTAMELKDAWSLQEKLWQTWAYIKKQRHYFADKGPSSQSYGFSSSHVWMWELDYKQSWAQKTWCFWTVV